METSDLSQVVEDLTGNIDDLEDSLAPLLKTPLSSSTSKLPLLDKAKLYVLATYALESILFSCLRLNGVDAKSHAVFQELARVKEYFGKIKLAETAGSKRSATLDKEAASRFIKHGLAGNERYDRERADRIAKEKAGAKRKLEDIATGTHTRFDGVAKRIKTAEGQSGAEISDGDLNSNKDSTVASAATTDVENVEPGKEVNKRQRRKRRKKFQDRAEEAAMDAPPVVDAGVDTAATHAAVLNDEAEDGDLSEQAPRSAAEALEAILDNASPKTRKKKRRKKSKEVIQVD